MGTKPSHRWKFFRSGGLEQVVLDTDSDVRHLHELNPKLWVALSCPVKGLEIDERTLALIDTNQDGRIRLPEILQAIEWLGVRLNNLGALLRREESMALSLIREDTPEGQAVLASARRILKNLGKPEDPGHAKLTVEDTTDTARIFGHTAFNGDGIITTLSTADEGLKKIIEDIAATQGGDLDRSGIQGVNTGRIEAFYKELAAFADWSDKGLDAAIRVAGDGTADALAAMQAVRAKIDDYFARTRLLAFDPRAGEVVNRSEKDYASFVTHDLKGSSEEMAEFPLAHVEVGKPLPLQQGVNPAWAGAMAAFHAKVVTPLLGADKQALTEQDWAAITGKLSGFEKWSQSKTGGTVEKLGIERVRALLAGSEKAQLLALIDEDKKLQAEAESIDAASRLVRYHRDFGTLLRNFVNFADFYDPAYTAIFQAGTLYLDSRSCDLCFRIDAPHPLAAMSKAYIAYCNVTREKEKMVIAACFTQGDSDYLFVGRHGIFWDRNGRDWDAVITSVVENPISIRQAFWLPYKRFLRMIEENVAKRAAAAEAASNARLSAVAESATTVDQTKTPPPPAAPKKVDIGTVAAIGVAVTGAVSALTLILGYVFGMKAWQYPLAFLGILLLISGPSVIIAWLKLRQRTLGPILDANGWAINGRVKINIPLGNQFTELPKIPQGSEVSRHDPFEDKASKNQRRAFIFIFLLLLAGSLWAYWDRSQRGHFFWQNPPPPAPAQAASAQAAPAEAAPAPAPAP